MTYNVFGATLNPTLAGVANPKCSLESRMIALWNVVLSKCILIY